jgi:hypothetical protein
MQTRLFMNGIVLVDGPKWLEAIPAGRPISCVDDAGKRRGSMHTGCDHLGSRALHGEAGRTGFCRRTIG